jgi:hypothetical protein
MALRCNSDNERSMTAILVWTLAIVAPVVSVLVSICKALF